jgi:hypothetical protein
LLTTRLLFSATKNMISGWRTEVNCIFNAKFVKIPIEKSCIDGLDESS